MSQEFGTWISGEVRLRKFIARVPNRMIEQLILNQLLPNWWNLALQRQ
jgi:hypothetical protein